MSDLAPPDEEPRADIASDGASPLPPVETVIALAILHVCTRKCFGVAGYATSCCQLERRDYIIGPIPDADAVLERLNARGGRRYDYEDVFIEFEEGRAAFPDRPSWQVPTSYPALRLDLSDSRLPCQFLGRDGLCSIHEIRSQTCRHYHREHLRQVLALL